MIQYQLVLPPPITAAQAASIIGRLGGMERARRELERKLAVGRQIRAELHLAPDPRLRG
jgi:hypothetical protein